MVPTAPGSQGRSQPRPAAHAPAQRDSPTHVAGTAALPSPCAAPSPCKAPADSSSKVGEPALGGSLGRSNLFTSLSPSPAARGSQHQCPAGRSGGPGLQGLCCPAKGCAAGLEQGPCPRHLACAAATSDQAPTLPPLQHLPAWYLCFPRVTSIWHEGQHSHKGHGGKQHPAKPSLSPGAPLRAAWSTGGCSSARTLPSLCWMLQAIGDQDVPWEGPVLRLPVCTRICAWCQAQPHMCRGAQGCPSAT